MKIAAANGLIIQLPAAYLLALWSARGQFDLVYWGVQIVELMAGHFQCGIDGLEYPRWYSPWAKANS